MSERVTIKSIAHDLGISHMTVSRALSGHPNVNPELRQSILDHANALDREPGADTVGNLLARLDVGGAKRFSDTVTALVDNELSFSVSTVTGNMTLA